MKCASFEALIPDMPYIGESNFHLQWFIPNSEKLAEYLVVKNYGVTKKEYSNLHLTQASKDLLNNYTEAQLIANREDAVWIPNGIIHDGNSPVVPVSGVS